MSAGLAHDGRVRCPWVDLRKPLYVRYHDEEWGVPVHDDQAMFEMLVLEGAQAGLSWYAGLSRREGYRRVFDGFDAMRIAAWDDERIAAAMQDAGIIRNRAKIAATVNNARCYLEFRAREGSFAGFLHQFAPAQARAVPGGMADYVATTPESDALSRELRRRGFRFVGSTILYAHMQATGIVNDHAAACFRRAELVTD